MIRRCITRLLLAILLVTGFWPVATSHAASLDKFADFRSYPYLDKAYREARRENWPEVDSLMTHLLGLVPENEEARRMQIQARLKQGHYEQALESANQLTDATQKQSTLQDLRIKWIAASPPDASQVKEWLDSTIKISDREQLWRAYANALSQRPDGDQKALAWLESVQGAQDITSLRRERAIWAEKLDDWRTIVAQLAPLAQQDRISPKTWNRLATAYVNLQDEAGLKALLPSAPDTQAAIDTKLAMANRAIALGNVAIAKNWLQALPPAMRDDKAQQQNLWELAQASGDTNLYLTTSNNLDRPCLEIAEWLSRNDKALALQQFAKCDARADPAKWLILAQRLDAIDLLKTQPLPEQFQSDRQNVLVGMWRNRGQQDTALAWLESQPQTASTLNLRGEILQNQHNDAAVEDVMTHLLSLAPDNNEARRTLVQAYLRQGQFEKAVENANNLRDGPQKQAILQELRIKWIVASAPDASLVNQWLDNALDPKNREQLWRAYATALSRQPDGDKKALAWLETVKGEYDITALRRERAVWAEKLDAWQTIVAELAPMAKTNTLSPTTWHRLATAYVNLQDEPGLTSLLATAPDMQAAIDARLAMASRAIALGNVALAKNWLQALPPAIRNGHAQQQKLWELAQASGDAHLYLTTSNNLDRPCLETTEWLSRNDKVLALQQFTKCDAQTNPATWLILAQRLDAIELLKTQPLPDKWQDERRNILVGILRDRGAQDAALSWLESQPQTVDNLKLRAEILQSQNNDTDAEKYWLAVYRKSGDFNALDQASFLALKDHRNTNAKTLLEQAYDQRKGKLPDALLHRLAAFYAQNITDRDLPRVKQLMTQIDGTTRGLLLAQLAKGNYCSIVAQTTHDVPNEPAGLGALGQCAMKTMPGVASIYYQKAADLGDDNSLPALAYALEAGGSPEQALKIWQKVPATLMSDNALLTAARSAVEAEKPDQAEDYWLRVPKLTRANDWALGATIAEAKNQPQLALQRQKQALRNNPSPENYYAAAATAQKAGEMPQSTAWLRKANALQPENTRYNADLGMRLASLDTPDMQKTAIPYLEKAVVDYPHDYRLHETLATRYNAVENSAAARQQLEQAIDLEQYPVSFGDDYGSLDARRYRQRRAHETLERRNSITLASTWSPAGVTDFPLGNNTTERRSASQNVQTLMWDHALGEEPVRNGSTLSVYGRVLIGGNGHSRYGQTVGTGAGMRYKPFGDYNLNLYSELYSQTRRDKSGAPGIKTGDILDLSKLMDGISDAANNSKRDNDLILRATASFFDQNEYRNDWRVDDDDWNERFLSIDLSWWTKSGNHMALSRFQQGHSFKLPTESPQTIMPYGFIEAGAQDPNNTWRQDLRAGVGVRWQLFSDDDKYNAYRTRINARIEVQKSLGGNLYEGASGILFGLEMNF